MSRGPGPQTLSPVASLVESFAGVLLPRRRLSHRKSELLAHAVFYEKRVILSDSKPTFQKQLNESGLTSMNATEATALFRLSHGHANALGVDIHGQFQGYVRLG